MISTQRAGDQLLALAALSKDSIHSYGSSASVPLNESTFTRDNSLGVRSRFNNRGMLRPSAPNTAFKTFWSCAGVIPPSAGGALLLSPLFNPSMFSRKGSIVVVTACRISGVTGFENQLVIAGRLMK